MKQNQLGSREDVSENLTNETHMNQSDLNSSSSTQISEEMLLSEGLNAISAYESMDLSDDQLLNEHVNASGGENQLSSLETFLGMTCTQRME